MLIKNDGKDAFPTIAAGAASNLYVDDADCGSNAIDDVGAYMANAQKGKIKVSSADNYVSINGKSYPGRYCGGEYSRCGDICALCAAVGDAVYI